MLTLKLTLQTPCSRHSNGVAYRQNGATWHNHLLTMGKIGIIMRHTMMKRTILVAILGLLAACGGEKDAETTRGAEQNGPIVSFETRDAGARRAVAEVPKDFSFLRYAVDETGTTPAFCLTFSAPLNPATDYSPYVTIEGEIALQVEGSRLCLPYPGILSPRHLHQLCGKMNMMQIQSLNE